MSDPDTQREHPASRLRRSTPAQVVLPVLIQPLVAPIHLLGYVLYNQPNASWAAHVAVIRRELWGTLIMRWLRIFPPFSIGTVLNTALRRAINGRGQPPLSPPARRTSGMGMNANWA